VLFGDPVGERVVEHLGERGYRRLLDLPVVPVTNAAGLRYDLTLPVLPGPVDFYVRSWGTGFDIVHRGWRRHGVRWFSVGWGVLDDRETERLLLVQDWSGVAGDVLTAIGDQVERHTASVDGAGCLRLAAVLRPAGGSGGG
jgi:hypothetical protein